MNILNLIKTAFDNVVGRLKNKDEVQFLGILGEQNRQNVFQFDEVVAGASAPVWETRLPRSFLSQYQYKSSACVAFTVAKIAQILYFLKIGRMIKFSPGWIYRKRNPKVEGMWIDNAVSLAGSGLPTEELYPSEGLTEEEINSLPDLPFSEGVAKEFALSVNWVELPVDFDTIASTIQKTKKGVMLWFSFGPGEWFGTSFPFISGSYKPYRHSVTAVDAVKHDGTAYIIIEDSADVSSPFKHQKYISRTFLSRCFLARYPLSFKYDATVDKPRYDKSIKSLQDCLRFEGVFPSNVPSTGFLGDITIAAIKQFQSRYNIQQTGGVGPVTTAKLVELYP